MMGRRGYWRGRPGCRTFESLVDGMGAWEAIGNMRERVQHDMIDKGGDGLAV